MSELFEFDGLRKFFQTGFRMVFERRIRFNPVHADISNRDLHYRFQLDLTAKVTAAGSAADDSPARLILVARACPWRSTRRRAVFVDSECEDLQIGATLHLLVQFFQVGQLSFAGTAPGRLDINQDGPASYTQNPAGALDINIAGTSPGTQFDRLAVTGTASLSGTLNIGLLNGFVPALGSVFGILTASSVSGRFATVNGASIDSSEHFVVKYNANNVTLHVVTGP
jgi:hypothetical protein